LVQFLQEIASEQQFEVTYVDIEEKFISGKFQCLVQLSILPVADYTYTLYIDYNIKTVLSNNRKGIFSYCLNTQKNNYVMLKTQKNNYS